MIRLNDALFAKLDGTIEGLRSALQSAVELEHATIPPYLYALYSLKPDSLTADKNLYAYQLLRSVVLEEMLHMVSACNILNAIGGAPVIDAPQFIPKYPGPLPGSVESGLVVGLRRFSLDVVEHTFMTIEEPEFRPSVSASAPEPADTKTIGNYYEEIAKHLAKLGDHVFTGDAARQVVHPLMPNTLTRVTDVATARRAIEIIVEQGEGTADSPIDPEDIPAHYYRFGEIVHGRCVILRPNRGPGEALYEYGGAVVPFDPSGVWPVVDDPQPSSYPAGSAARVASDTFNYSYTALLKALHRSVNGSPKCIVDAVGLMESLRAQAMCMMALPLANGHTVGPTFQYQPVLPL